MNTVHLHFKGGLSAPALLGVLMNLGVENNWLVSELKKLYTRVSIKTIEGLCFIEIPENDSNGEIMNNLEKTLLDNKMQNIFSKTKLLLKENDSIDDHSLQRELLYCLAFSLCLKCLDCNNISVAALELCSIEDIRLLKMLKGINIRVVNGRSYTYDYCVAAFLGACCVDTDSLPQGKVKNAAAGHEGDTTINALLIEDVSCFEKDLQYIVECNIDDMNSEGYDYIFNKLLERGALDVYITPIIMKKGRPAVKLSVLVSEEKLELIKECIFAETSTFGVRSYKVDKSMLERSFGSIFVYGEKVRVKYGYYNGKVIKCKPEYEDCRKIAQYKGIGINKVYTEALRNIPAIDQDSVKDK